MIRSVLLSVLVVLLSAAWSLAADISVHRVAGEREIAAYDLVQWSVDLGRSYKRPFDLDQIAVDATFTDEKGTKWVMPAFWYDPPADASLAGDDMPPAAQWRIRFSPPHAGKWTIAVTAKDKTDTRSSDAVSFEVKPSANPGIVRRRSDSERYFKFDSGAPFFMVGLNLPFGEGKNHLAEYRERLSKLHKAGGNYARVFIIGKYIIESYDSGIGRYGADASAYYDRIFEMAQKNDIHLMFTINTPQSFGSYNGVPGSRQWANNPYNSINAGPVPFDDKMQFFTNPKARKLYKQYLRYLVARYSAYNPLAFWEMWTEQEHIRNVPVAWTEEMASYLHEVDPYNHLVTNASSQQLHDHWKVSAIDMTQQHLYGYGTQPDLSSGVTASVAYYSQFHKPHLLGEFGITWNWSDPPKKLDTSRKGTGLHNGLWASTMSGCAGAAVTWWWHYVEDYDLWHLYTPISRFANSIPWSQRNFAPLLLDPPQKESAGPETWGDLAIKTTTIGFGLPPYGVVRASGNGQALPGIPSFLFGPSRKSGASPVPILLSVDFPKASTMLVRVKDVFDSTDLQISIDDKLADEFKFKAAPGAPEAESIEEKKQYHVYKATINKDRTVEVPAGRHTIKLENMASGNWVTIDSITFKGMRSSKFTDLETYAIQDEPTGETLVWILDPESNWMNDAKGIEPKPREESLLSIPLPKSASGSYAAQWWDTRAGKVIKEDKTEVKDGAVRVTVPAFTRDIALRLYHPDAGAAREAGSNQ